MSERGGEASARGRVGEPRELRGGSLRHHLSAARAGARAQIDDVVGAADGVFVVLDHHQRVALLAQPIQGVEEHEVVARMQADGGLVEHVAHALQVRAQLGRQPDALGLAARQRRRRPVELQIAEPHVAEKGGAGTELGQEVPGDLELAARQFELAQRGREFLQRQMRELRDREAAEQHVPCHGIEPCSGAVRTGGRLAGIRAVRCSPLRFLAGLIRIEFDELQPRTEAALAPAVPGVEGEQPRIELREAGAAVRAGALGGEHRGHGIARGSLLRRGREHLYDAPSVFERRSQRLPQLGFVLRADRHGRHRQLDAVLDEPIQARPFRGGKHGAVHAQLGEALAAPGLGERRVEALARHDERRQQRDLASAVFLEQPRGDGVGGLRLDARPADGAVLHARA